jgi:hypothetical protein
LLIALASITRRGAGLHAHGQRPALFAQHLGLGPAHFGQFAGAALVAGALGGDRAIEPIGLALDGFVQPPQGLGLIGGDLVGPGVEIGEALVQPPDPAVLQPERALGGALQERPIVADDQRRGSAGPQLGLQRLDGEDVQVIGGLVQQQHVRPFGEGPRQRGAAALAAREPQRRALWVEIEQLQHGLGLVGQGAARCGVVEQGRALDTGFLAQQGHAQAGCQETVAAVRLDLARQNAQQGRLAGSVAADQAGAHPGLQAEVDAVEQHARAVGQPHVLQCDQGRPGVQWSGSCGSGGGPSSCGGGAACATRPKSVDRPS